MRLIVSDFGNTKCVECKLNQATMLLKLGKRKDGYYLCNHCKNKLSMFLKEKENI